MDRQIRRHLDRRGIRLAYGRPAEGLLGTDGGAAAFLRWFHEDVMGFDSAEYRRQFWREACRHGHTIGPIPRTAAEFTDPRRHPYNEWLANLVFLMLAMGVSAVVWWLVRGADAHVRRLRRPTYYEAERARRLALAEERRRITRRTTTSPCPTADMLRATFARVRESTSDMIRFGSMLEDLECYADNSVVWRGGRIVGRRGGIRQWLQENAPDLSARYKTVMKYKALSKRFRQAVGVSDPIPAAAILPPDPPGESEGKGEGTVREHCSERILRGQGKSRGGDMGRAAGREKAEAGQKAERGRKMGKDQKTGMGRGRTPEEAARALLAACEGTVASLAAQLAMAVSADFVLDENTVRTTFYAIGRARSSA